ncbi:DNA replication complex GINS protein SLD5-like [Populus alba]|uniref:DNA replication complex GINS protein SLD5-like n=1 Tax=Populus alba TaxID=43335 RepID=UPI003CC76ABE
MQIEKYLFYILKTDEYLNRFSKQDQMFARRCTDDLGRHLDDTVLARLPDNYQSTLKQSITSEEDDMATLRMIWEFILMRLFCQICWHLPVLIKQSIEDYNMAWKSQRWSGIYLPSYVTSS